MGIDKSWSFLKARQTTLSDWGAMPKPLGDAVEKPDTGSPQDNKKRLLGLKPSDFHLTSLITQRPQWNALADYYNLSNDLTTRDPSTSKLKRIYDWYHDNWDELEDDDDVDVRDEYMKGILSDLFGEKQYALWAPKGAVSPSESWGGSFYRGDYTPSSLNASGRFYDPDTGLLPHEEAYAPKGMIPIGRASMAGPHVSYIQIDPRYEGQGLGTLLGQQILGREGALMSSARTDKGQGLAARAMKLIPKGLRSAAGRKLGKIPHFAELGPLHNMELGEEEGDTLFDTISHFHLPEKWGSLRPDITTVPWSEHISEELKQPPLTPPQLGKEPWKHARGQTRLTPNPYPNPNRPVPSASLPYWEDVRPKPEKPTEQINEPTDWDYDPDYHLASEPMDLAFRLLKHATSPEALRHKVEYDTEYESNPKRVKYREDLNRERRKRGIYGRGGPDISHTRQHTLVEEDPHANRARHFKERGTLKSVGVR